MTVTVVGIGADGWAGLGDASRRALASAALIVGSRRQLDLLPGEVGGRRRRWPSPMAPLVDELAGGALGDAAVLASGDPLLHGVGATLIEKGARIEVLPHPSAFALACARMGWPQAGVELVNVIARPPEAIAGWLQPGRRIVAYTTDAAAVARVLCERGAGAAAFTVLEQLGGPRERRIDTTAEAATELAPDPLHCVAISVEGGPGHARTAGLPDAAFASDGQLTKRHVRALTIAALAPLPGERLWDVGAGNGSIAVEWLRAERSARAIAVEPREDRAARIARNALAHGVPDLHVVRGRAPEALSGLPAPDAIFIGGGIAAPGVLDACWAALPSRGRLVANTVTLEGEQTVVAARARRGGTLTRIDIAHAEPVGAFTGWRAQMTVTQWSVTKP